MTAATCSSLGRHDFDANGKCVRCDVVRIMLAQPKLDLMDAYLMRRESGPSNTWLWWGPDRRKYVGDLLRAGLYSRDEALRLERTRVGHAAVPLAGELLGLKCGSLGAALGLPLRVGA